MIEITRIFDLPLYQKEKYNLSDALTTKVNGVWTKTSSEEYISKSNSISKALLKMGVKKGDKIAIISTNNRTEWHLLDVGITQIGALSVPIYPNISELEYEYIFNHSEAIYCFISDEILLNKINNIRKNCSFLKDVFSFDEIYNCHKFSDLIDYGKSLENQHEVDETKKTIQPEDLATLIYTSGTTGILKGVMLSHKNLVSNLLSSAPRVPLVSNQNTVALSFLPVCHVFERMILYLYQYSGIPIYFGESIDKISDNIKEVRPSIISIVPRVLEKIYTNIVNQGTKLSYIKKKIFFWAIGIGFQYEPYKANSFLYDIKLYGARKLIFDKWLAALGGNLQFIVSGGVALQPRLTRLFTAAGVYVLEGYGTTETSPVIAVNSTNKKGLKIGTVGKILDNLKVIIAEDGEILCKGDSVMQGYYKDKKLTAEAFKNGFFCTGDVGEIDEEGFLKITDRKKEIFKTSGGKYISPQQIENAMKKCRFIEQIMIVGEGKKMPAAIIQPNFEVLIQWAKRHRFHLGDTYQEIISNEIVLGVFEKEINSANKQFGSWEQIKSFRLTHDLWSIEKGHLTPTLKLKRKNILEIYKDLYDNIYNEN